jgi:Cdc6-like AAA superfamily ATPase
MKYLNKYVELIILLIFFGCAQNSDSANMEMADEEMVAPTTEQKTNETVERKLIKEGYIEFETDNLNSTRKTIFEAVKKYKGYVSSDQEFKSPGRKSNTVVIRVPADNFDNLLKDATQGVEKFESKEIKVKDVTEEFLDIQARLKTKKELENRFVDLLKEAKNVTEILEIEKQIGQLRSEIESIEGRLKYLQDKISLSTLTMTFYERIPNETEFGQKFKNGFKNGWDNLILFFVVLTNIWPFILIGLGLIIGIRFYRKRK